MISSNLVLKPVTRKFTNHRGKYPRLIREFLASSENELEVCVTDSDSNATQNTYMGLRTAVSSMGLRNKVAVCRQDGEIHLIKVG